MFYPMKLLWLYLSLTRHTHAIITHLPLVCFQQMEGQRSYGYATCLESSLCVELQPRHGARLALHWCFEMNGARPPPMVLCRARTKLIVVCVRTLRSHCPFFCFAAAGRTRWFGSSTRAPLIVADTLAHSADRPKKLSGWMSARDTYVSKQLQSTRSAGSAVHVLYLWPTHTASLHVKPKSFYDRDS